MQKKNTFKKQLHKNINIKVQRTEFSYLYVDIK